LTQGLRDSVCSPQHLRNLLKGLEIPTLTLREFPEALHEPFADATGPEVCLAMAQWLEQISKA
jgi:alpha-beta hydrolase superfamily lysophospholipase